MGSGMFSSITFVSLSIFTDRMRSKGVRVGAVVSMQLCNEEGARNLAASEKL
jgi:hypothetical protein